MRNPTSTRRQFLKAGGAAVAGAYALGLAGCGGSGGGAAELTLLEHQEPRVKLLEELLPRFEKEMRDRGQEITVELQEGPAPDPEFLNKLTLDYSSGNAPDVASFGNNETARFASSGYLLDLTSNTERWADWRGHFYGTLREGVTQPDGKIYAVPREAQIMQLFYRRDVLEQNGISTEQPRSWEELLDRAKESTRATGSPSLLFPAGAAWGGGTLSEGFIHLLVGTDSPIYEDGKWVVRSPGLTSVLNYYEEMVDAGVLPVQPLLNPEPWVPTKYEAFPKGELTATTCGTWCWSFDWGPEGAAPIDDLFQKVDTWQFPTEAGDETFIWGATGWVWAISAETEYPDAAWELVKWLSSGEAVARNAVTVGAASPRDDLAGVAPYSEQEFLIEAEKQLPEGRSFPFPEGSDKFAQAVGEATQAVITGESTGEEAAELLANQAGELLGEDRVKAL